MQKSALLNKLRLIGTEGYIVNYLDKVVFWDNIVDVEGIDVLKDGIINGEWLYIQYIKHCDKSKIISLLGKYYNKNLVRLYNAILKSTYNNRPIGDIIHRYIMLSIVYNIIKNLQLVSYMNIGREWNNSLIKHYSEDTIIEYVKDNIEDILLNIICIISKENILSTDRISSNEMEDMYEISNTFDKTVIIEIVDGVINIRDSKVLSDRYIEYFEIKHSDGRAGCRVEDILVYSNMIIKDIVFENPYVELSNNKDDIEYIF